jgi:AraC-like DNA-binding protein
VKSTWPPRDWLRTPAPLFAGQDPDFLAYFHPTPRPFYLFGAAHFPAGRSSSTHSHPCVAFHSCLQGPVSLVTADQELSLDADVFYLLAPGVRHQWQNRGAHTAATMAFLIDADHPGSWPAGSGIPECCRDLTRLITGVHCFQVAGDSELQQAFWQLADHLMSERPGPRVTTVGLLCTLLGRALVRLKPSPEASAAHPDAAQKIRRLLLARVREQLSIEEIASEVCVSPTQAKKVFRQAFGCGIISYFRQLKIWQAKRLLGNRELTVEQVSCQLGFSSPTHFSRMFFRLTGETASAFRKRHAENP